MTTIYEHPIYGAILHLHTLFSLNDGCITPAELKQFCLNNNVKAVAITDHGHCMAHDAFRAEFANSDVKLLFGVEAYVPPLANNTLADDNSETDEEDTRTAHLVLLAKDHDGLKCIYRMVTAGYDNLVKNKPVITQAVLNEYCAPGKPGHNHIIALSACMQGVLSIESLHNELLERQAAKILRKADRVDLDMGKYDELTAHVREMSDELDALKERRQTLNALKNKKYTSRIKAIEKLRGTADYESEKAKLDEEIAETEKATAEFSTVKANESALSKQLTALKSELKKLETKASRLQDIQEQADAVREQAISDDKLYDNTLAAAHYYANLFGEGNFYVELQYHGIEAEATCFPMLAEVAEELNLPVVATNDSHIISNTPEQRRKRQILRSLRFNKWEEEMTGDSELYIKSDDEVREALLQILPPYIVDDAIANTNVIAEQCNVEFPKEEHYPKFQSPDDRAPLQVMKDLCHNRFLELEASGAIPKNLRKVYIDRVMYELGVIEKLGVVDYLLIVQDFLEYGRLLGRIDLNDPRFLADPYNIDLLKKLGNGNVGMSIGIGRGSAVGSLVCYLIGITGADPIKYNLLFERFLNTERVTMPDIDSDFAVDVRGKVLDYVKHKYGEAAVCCIATIGTQGVKNAIRNCARLLGDRKYQNPKALLSLSTSICAEVPNEPNVKFKDCIDDLRTKFSGNEDAMTVLDEALIVEGTFTQVGMHAAGVIIADNGDVGEYTPLMKAKDGQWVSQCDMNYTEAKGLLKMDFLGLRNLSIITDTLRAVQKNYGVSINMDEVDLADADVYANIFAKGNTDSVFQFESGGMKRMLQDFKPSNIEDLTLLVAAYRPGPLQYLGDIINTKASGKEPRYIIPEMKEVLGVTYGKPIYQEQVMSVFNKFAGFSLGESDIIRRYMSKKKTEKFMAYHDKFIDGLVASGAKTDDAEDFWTQLVDFSKYAFNKSHACAYAITAYYTGWLKYHYPKEYLASVANLTEFEKLESIIRDIRSFNVPIYNPDVNLSGAYFDTIDGVRYGLSNVKGVASAGLDIVDERNANGMYTSLEDFINRAHVSRDVVSALISAGALDSLGAEYGNTFWARRINMLQEIGEKPEAIPSDRDSCLANETKYLGAYVTENPALGCKAKNTLEDLPKLEGKYVELAGAVSNFEVKTTKSGTTMAVFNIVDENYRSVPAVCFSDAYARSSDALQSVVCRFNGKVQRRNDTLTLVVDSVASAAPIIKTIVLTPEKTNYLKPYNDLYTKYKDEKGVPLLFLINGKPTNMGNIKVNPCILNDAELSKVLAATY